jgi:hypothetical protein
MSDSLAILPIFPLDMTYLILKATAFDPPLRKERITNLLKLKTISKALLELSNQLEVEGININKWKIGDCLPLKIPSDFKDSPCPYIKTCDSNRKTVLSYIQSNKGLLTVLDIRYFRNFKMEEIEIGLNAQPKLNTVHISNSKITNKIVSVLKKLSYLRHLHLLSTDELGDTEIDEIITDHPYLESLVIQGPKITRKVIDSLSKLTNLSSLIIVRCYNFTDEDYKQLVINHPNLLSLHIVSSNITDAGLGEIVKLTGLKNLKIMGCGGVEDISSLRQLANLEELSIGRCSNEQRYEFLDELIHLKKFRMPWYTCIPEDRRPTLDKLKNLGVHLKLSTGIPDHD